MREPAADYYNSNLDHAIPIGLPRRDLFDIRAQLMAEEDPLSEDQNSLASLSTDDLKPRIYEGGFKTWDCSVDLAGHAQILLARVPAGDLSVVEVRSMPCSHYFEFDRIMLILCLISLVPARHTQLAPS